MSVSFQDHVVEIIIPEFNELSKLGENFDQQLRQFEILARKFDVFLVDDCSTDGSWERLVRISPEICPHVHLVRMKRNGQKILAIKHAIEKSDANYILLTDFDSRIVNPEDIPASLQKFSEVPRLGGLALKLVPEGSFVLSRFQDMEYAIGRGVFSRYMNSQRKLRCVPGAAGIWDRRVLLEILKEHSGRHNGDDLEITAIASRMGYATQYEPSIVVKTAVPRNATELFRQRRRWELGSLETYYKERGFYWSQVKNHRSRIGHMTLFDWYTWLTVILFPVFLANWFIHPTVMTMIGYACFEYFFVTGAGYISRNELQDRRELALIPIFPIYLFLASLPRFVAVYNFMRGRHLRRKAFSHSNLRPVGIAMPWLHASTQHIPAKFNDPRDSLSLELSPTVCD